MASRLACFPGAAAIVILAVALSGCARNAAPSLILAGSYFPAWMACATAGIVLALALRLVFGRLGLDRRIAGRLSFYSASAVSFGALIWLFYYGR